MAPMAPLVDVRVCADATDLAWRVAEDGAAILVGAIRANGRCSLALSGGSTPRALYSRWASAFADRIPWPRVHVFWGDERFVPPDDPRSNYRLARETLLDHVPCSPENIHRMAPAVAVVEV